MMYKLILVPMLGWSSDRRALEVAVPLARACRAHLAAVYIPGYAPSVLTDDQSGDLRLARQRVDFAREHAAAREGEARSLLLEICDAAGCTLRDEWWAGDGDSASWQVLDEPKALTSLATYVDLVCLATPSDAGSEAADLREALLFQAAAPLLHLSGEALATGESLVGRPVLMAWNGSVQAMGAARAALPLLQLSNDIQIVTPRDRGADPDLAETIRHWLSLHGCRAREVDSTVVEDATPDLGRIAVSAGAGLLVMGAYTHSRLRQQILGGVTRTVLESAPLPVLLKH